ncbi:MAG: baseplate J/gp47 family protein [Proteobacteria bacterium]|nr:baseplate J/gp47 family protein [Pseudomonadota bacterium]
MQLSLQNFGTLVQNMAAAVQSSAAQLVDMSVGSVLRALLEANASVGLWMQWLILQVLQTTRASTSVGPDLDSWMADFALLRLPAVTATGVVTFSRYTPVGTAFVPVGALVRTSDGSQTYAVSADASNPAWSPTQSGYVVPANASSADLPVVAQVPGAAGNVQANTVTLLASAIPGIDYVSNSGPFANGLDAESDSAFRARFQNYINSRSRATKLAVGYAISNIQQGLLYTILENQDASGNAHPGNFVVTVDDGTGHPSASLLSTVQTAVDAVRPVGSTFAVQAPAISTVNVSMTLTVAAPATTAQFSGAVAQAVASFVDALPIGAPLPLSRVSQVAYGVSASILNVSQVALNGAAADITPPANGVVKVGTVAVD